MRSSLLSLATALVAAVSAAPWRPNKGYNGDNMALYILDDDPKGSSVVAMKINGDGSLCCPKKTSTGGYGATAVGVTGPLSNAPLVSQGSVRVYDEYLFTVNAGSNTISMFRIDPCNPQDLYLVGCPAAVDGGNFPLSLDYSPWLRKVCVLTGGNEAGVQCFHADATYGLQPLAPIRPIGSPYIDNTNPPKGPFGTASQLSFTPRSDAVVVTIKGNPSASPPVAGTILVYPIDRRGDIAKHPKVTQFANSPIPFSFSFTEWNEFFLVDPSFGGELITINRDYSLTQTAYTNITGQKATCWSATNLNIGKVYGVDAASNNLWTLNAQTLAMETPISFTEPNNGLGLFDSVVLPNGMYYGLTGEDGIQSLNTNNGAQGMYFDTTSVAPRGQLTGMAYWAPRW